MNNLQLLISNYLEYCKTQKRLDEKTLKAYIIDLKQFSTLTSCKEITTITPNTLETHIAQLHQQYKPKTVKRKIAFLFSVDTECDAVFACAEIIIAADLECASLNIHFCDLNRAGLAGIGDGCVVRADHISIHQ